MVTTPTAERPEIPGSPVQVQVWGEMACFTRPEFGAEKVSYPMMTPTAAKGFLEALFWKPEFEWEIIAIDVLRPAQWMSLFRNGVSSRQTAATASKWAKSGHGSYDAAADRQQFRTLLLRDVAYVVHAEVRVVRGSDSPAKYRDQFRRRVGRGQFFSPPYLGCREFLASFGEPDGTPPIDESFNPGAMPARYDRDDDDYEWDHQNNDPTKVGAVTDVHWADRTVVAGRLLVGGGR